MSVPMTSKHHNVLALALLRAKPERDKYLAPVYLALYREWIRCIKEIILTMEQDSQGFNKLKFLKILFNETEQINLKGAF